MLVAKLQIGNDDVKHLLKENVFLCCNLWWHFIIIIITNPSENKKKTSSEFAKRNNLWVTFYMRANLKLFFLWKCKNIYDISVIQMLVRILKLIKLSIYYPCEFFFNLSYNKSISMHNFNIKPGKTMLTVSINYRTNLWTINMTQNALMLHNYSQPTAWIYGFFIVIARCWYYWILLFYSNSSIA